MTFTNEQKAALHKAFHALRDQCSKCISMVERNTAPHDLNEHTETMLVLMSEVNNSIGHYIGASAILKRVSGMRAKTLSSSRRRR